MSVTLQNGVYMVSTYLWRGLRVIIGPGCGVRGGRCSGGADRNSGGSIGRQRLSRCLYLDPLLRSSQVVACVPLVLRGGIRSGVADISIRDCALRSSLVRVSVRQSIVCASIDLSQASIGDGWVGLEGLGGLDGLSLGLGLGCRLVEGSRVGGG